MSEAPLPTGAYVFPTRALGNPDLQEERLDPYGVGYVGTWGVIVASGRWALTLLDRVQTHLREEFLGVAEGSL